jgi:hypothetical protein
MQRKNNLLSLIKKISMKSILVLLFFCNSSFFCFGQQKVEPGLSTIDTAFFNNIKHFQLVPASEILVSKIKILPIDNMPCLVTNEKLIIPIPNAVINNDMVNNMPNPLKKQE